MKNKKLFAILTLVCFMFTLMPVAAFAADVQETYIYTAEENAQVDVYEKVKLTFPTGLASLYVWFEETTDVPTTALGWIKTNGAEDATGFVADQVIELSAAELAAGEVEVAFKRDGVYTLKAATINPETQTGANWAERMDYVADYALQTQEGYNVVDVAANSVDSNDYVVKFAGDAVVYEDNDTKTITVDAEKANGIEEKEVKFVVYENDKAGANVVYANNIKVDTSSNVSVTDVKAKRSGEVTFNVVAEKAGTHKVYVTIDSFKLTIKVNANEGKADEIVVSNAPQTAVNIETVNEYSGFAGFLGFDIFDENGNKLTDENASGLDGAQAFATNYVSVVEQPAKSKIENKNLALAYQAYNAAGDEAWTIVTNKAFKEEGEYTFKVALDNGEFVKATVKLVEANDPVALSISYFTDSVQLGGTISPKSIGWLDENYAFTTAVVGTDVVFTASGAAVEKVEGSKIFVKADEKYVGSKIEVAVVDEENDLVVTKTLTVANEAKELAFNTTTAPVDMTRTIGVSLVDEDGKTVGLNATTASAYVVVLAKPADCDVTADASAVNKTKGTFGITFSADKVGAVTLQAVLKAEVDGVVRYYTGTQVVTVGAAGIDDIVVMSIGSNEVVINGEVKAIDAAPIVENNRTFVPFRALAEAFGATVAYDEATQAVTAELNGVTVVMTIGSAEYTVNGEAATMDVAPFINGSRTMIPVRFAAQAFGIDVTPTYDDNGATADVVFTK